MDTAGLLKGVTGMGSRARRKLLTAEEAELFELAQAAGSGIDPEVFKILMDLLRMNVAPLAVFQMLRSMCAGQRLISTEAPPDIAREPPIVSAKASKIPEPLSFFSVLRPSRIRVPKAVVYSPAAACSPLSQGRAKTISTATGNQPGSDHSNREGSSQRVPRQSSASRLPKTGCPVKNT